MRRVAGILVALLVFVVGIGAIVMYQQVSTLDEERVTEDVHVLYGLGSNVAILRTDVGAVVVDTMSTALQGRRIRGRAEVLGGGATQLLVNTHYHMDHTHGNPAFAAGLDIVSTVRTRAYLAALDSGYWEGAAGGTLPNETFEDWHEVRIGGKTVRFFHPGRGHTDGDLVVLFVEDRVLHTGDLFFNGRYPNIDLEAGGSVREWSASIDRILELHFDRVIPGHGPVTDRDGLMAFQQFIQQLAAVGATAARGGLSLEETRERAVMDADVGYDVMSIPLVMRIDRDFVIRRSWEEATGRFTRVSLPEGG